VPGTIGSAARQHETQCLIEVPWKLRDESKKERSSDKRPFSSQAQSMQIQAITQSKISNTKATTTNNIEEVREA
jgi:hypothetical protein